MKKLCRRLLFPISTIFWLIVVMRRFAYQKGWLRSTTFEIPTVCVGNLDLGGTGKTPHVEYITRFLSQHYQIAILSRGYGRKTKGYINAQETKNLSSEIIGDEPLQYVTKFPNVEVAVCEKRKTGIEKFVEKNPKLEIVVLDDSYQHLSVNYSARILLTDFYHPFFNNFLFPIGTLRDYRNAAKYADIILVTKCPENLSYEEKAFFFRKLKLKPQQEVYFTKVRYKSQVPSNKSNINNNYISNLPSHYLLVTGIANPAPLVTYMENKYGIIHHLRFSDHHSFTIKDIEKIIKTKNRLGGKNCTILTTEKDAMRLRSFANMPEYITIPIEVEFLENEIAFKEKLLSLLFQ
ncbi:MAG: tetraacyldisaccharide 4'-kinase [Bacteroidales bacterium]|jgi:tetraacyldisaccharide 4'-kinase|nr:tetraacyldisaccharide 4'-kinase [Bacteroidales bacterium]